MNIPMFIFAALAYILIYLDDNRDDMICLFFASLSMLACAVSFVFELFKEMV